MDPHPEDFGIPTGEEFREMRKAVGLSQRDVARLLGITDAAVTRWEGGEDPTIQNCRRYLQVLRIAFCCESDGIVESDEAASVNLDVFADAVGGDD